MAQYSYNGWLASPDPKDFGGLEVLNVRTETFPPGVRAGDVHDVLQYVATQLDKRVEKVDSGHSADDWGYNFRKNRNADDISCHGSATAFDYNAVEHPNGKRGTWSATQKKEIKEILSEVDNVVRNLESDEMHFEIHGTAAQVAKVAHRLRNGVAPSKVTKPKPTPAKAAVQVKGNDKTPELKKGSQGPDVKRLQTLLNKQYPAYSNLVVDGDFADKTDHVVRIFQQKAGLHVDGVVGDKTWAKLGVK